MTSHLDLTPAQPWVEITTQESDWASANPQTLETMLGQLHLIRAFEEAVLQLASDEELEQIYGALYGATSPSHSPFSGEISCTATPTSMHHRNRILVTPRLCFPFITGNSFLSPLGKSLQTAEPALLHYQGRDVLAGHIERRFRFLAADAPSTLRGRWPSYRETLLSIREKLDVPCPSRLSTNDLESEIFLFLLLEHSDAVGAQSIHDSPSIASAAAVAKHAEDGDGMAQAPAVRQTPNLVQRIFAPLRLGAEEVLPPLTKLGATVALTNLQASVARRLGTVLTSRSVQYEITLRMAMSSGARGVAAGAQGRMAMQAAHKGLTAAATRYAAVRSLLGFIGPVMWASTLLDLAKMSIGTDYARVVKAVFMLAQIRLLRMRGWDLPSGEHTRHDEKQL